MPANMTQVLSALQSGSFSTPTNQGLAQLVNSRRFNLKTNAATQARQQIYGARPQQNQTTQSHPAFSNYRTKAESIIDDGSRANEYTNQAVQVKQQREAEYQQRLAAFNAAQSQQRMGGSADFYRGGQVSNSASDVDRYLAALRQVESSGNYRARSRISSASGAYQYITSTWGNYGGYRTAAEAPPHVQDARARADALAAFNKYGSWEKVAASHFYPAWANRPEMWNRSPGRGNPTVNSYVRKVIGLMGQPSGRGNQTQFVGGDVSNIRRAIVNTGLKYQGIPYVWGGKTPRGFDCSGLTSYVYRQFGINLPAWSNHQTQFGRRAHISTARPGDLVGWDKGGHVAIYIGNGRILHSPRPGTRVHTRALFPGEKVYAVRLTLPGD